MASHVSHVELLRAAREVTTEPGLFVAGWRRDGGPGCWVGHHVGESPVTLADAATYEEALEQLRALPKVVA